MSKRRGIAFMEVASRLPHTPSSSLSRDRGHDRISAVGEDHVVCGVAHAVDLYHARTGKASGAAQQVDALIGQPAFLSGVGVVRDHEVAPRQRRLDVDFGSGGGRAGGMDRLTGPQQCFGRDACPVRALTADQFALHHGHVQAALGELSRAVFPRRATPDHDHVVVAFHVGNSSPACSRTI
jgi:hypothetical protein